MPGDRTSLGHPSWDLTPAFVHRGTEDFHARSYVITDVWMRLLASTVVALTGFMFDRALYQSDWFYQGILQRRDCGTDWWQSFRRFLRIAILLSIYFGLA